MPEHFDSRILKAFEEIKDDFDGIFAVIQV
jgi:hypothetical protein